MITVDYSEKKIKVTLDLVSKILGKNKLPLKVDIVKKVSGESWWSTEIGDSSWATFPDTEINDVVITDKNGDLVYKYEWKVLEHGSIFYKSLYYYCKRLISENKKPKGLVIGSHDGEFGEWVPLSLDNLSDIVLVEGSEKQFQKLKENFKDSGHQMIREIVTPNGGKVEFFEGGRGYTNSVVERVIRNWETEEINSSLQDSVSLNDLIESIGGNLDWIHMDVEGLDVKLLLSLKKENIPNLIIYEDNNLNDVDKSHINDWVKINNFNHISSNGISMLSRL